MSSALFEADSNSRRILDEPVSPNNNPRIRLNHPPSYVLFAQHTIPLFLTMHGNKSHKKNPPTGWFFRTLLFHCFRLIESIYTARPNHLAKINPPPFGSAAISRASNAQQPTAEGSKGRIKCQAASFHNPENHHDNDGRNKSPKPRMNKKQQDSKKSPRIEKKETRWFLCVAPMNVHVFDPVKSS